jgi:hypothetical protein
MPHLEAAAARCGVKMEGSPTSRQGTALRQLMIAATKFIPLLHRGGCCGATTSQRKGLPPAARLINPHTCKRRVWNQLIFPAEQNPTSSQSQWSVCLCAASFIAGLLSQKTPNEWLRLDNDSRPDLGSFPWGERKDYDPPTCAGYLLVACILRLLLRRHW